MYTLLSEVATKLCGTPEYNLAILGLEQTGKTQMLKALKDETSPYMVGLKQEYKPTIGLNTKQVSRKGMRYLVWDLGGKISFRKVWENYYPFCHGLVYLFDERIHEGMECLTSILSHPEMARIPVLIFIRNNELYTKILQKLDKIHSEQYMMGRAVLTQLLPHSRERLYENLQELYKLIRKLDIQIRR